MVALLLLLLVSEIAVGDRDMAAVLLLLLIDLLGVSEEDGALNQFDMLSVLSLDGESGDRAIRISDSTSTIL